jgi:hypothetical protein
VKYAVRSDADAQGAVLMQRQPKLGPRCHCTMAFVDQPRLLANDVRSGGGQGTSATPTFPALVDM